jgi:hypothetical protein
MSKLSDKKEAKRKIIQLFNKNVKGKIPDISKSNKKHDGKDGHWLEKQMGIKHNADNEPDIFGFEMKNNTTSKTSFGDWSADYYIYNEDKNFFNKKRIVDNRDTFLKIFGGNPTGINGRFSWSGKSVPKIKKFNDFGQILEVDKNNNILVIYNFNKDKRLNKDKIIPEHMKKNKLLLAKWSNDFIKNKVESKFNHDGWFKCQRESRNGAYTRIVFGGPINFDSWIDGVKKGLIYFDSAMHVGNSRNYSQWRADNKYWDSLVIESH